MIRFRRSFYEGPPSFNDYEVQYIAIVFIFLLLFLYFVSRLRLRPTDFSYGYKPHNGPHMWKERFPESRGKLQSPISIYSGCSIVVPSEILNCLRFSPEYHIIPTEMKICNNGLNVSVYGQWSEGSRPTVCGGPLTEPYEFVSIIFRWGPTNTEGTEHTVDSKRYALEAQALHMRAGPSRMGAGAAGCNIEEQDVDQLAKSALFISYLYEVTPIDNPYIEPLIAALKYLREPFTGHTLIPMPIAWLIPPFTSKYYYYKGSLTEPPCTEGVKWIVQPEPLSISDQQVRKFRKLLSIDGPLSSNTRPVQDLNDREVFYYG